MDAGTAQVTINDKVLGTTEQVQCTTVGWLTMITANYGDSGATAMVSNKDELNLEVVDINNLGGFTGSFNAGLTGLAKVGLPGRTYEITGTADGFNTDNPSFRAGGTFAIKAAC